MNSILFFVCGGCSAVYRWLLTCCSPLFCRFCVIILAVGVCGLGPALERVLLQCGLGAAFTLQRSRPVQSSLHRRTLLVCSMPALLTCLLWAPGATCMKFLVCPSARRAGLARVQTLVVSCAMAWLRLCCVCTKAARSMCVPCWYALALSRVHLCCAG